MKVGVKSFLLKAFLVMSVVAFSQNAAFCSGHGEGVSPSSSVVFNIGGFSVTDSVILSWIISVCIILLVRVALKGGVKVIPSTGQAIIESLVGGLGDIIKPVVGEKAFKTVFPCLLAYFVFVLLHNISGLIPGIGSIGMYINGEFTPFYRPANSDLNTTLALAIVAFFAWAYYCIKCAGLKGLYSEVFGNKADKSEMASAMYNLLFLIFFAVGFIECISILCRIVSLSFRLFGNTFGGENLLHNMYGFSEVLKNIPVVNYLSYLIPLPFYFLEFLVAIIQAFVFTLLVSVYIGLVCNHGDHEHEKEFLKKEEYVECNS